MLDFVSAVKAVQFAAISEADFSRPYISCSNFSILDDKIAFEGDETFTVMIKPLASAELGGNSTANITILDNDGN